MDREQERNAALEIEAAAHNRGLTSEAQYEANLEQIWANSDKDECQFPNDPTGCIRHPRK